MIFGHPVWELWGSCVELIKLPPIPDPLGSPGIYLLFHLIHNHWTHFRGLDTATTMTLAHITTCYLHPLLGRPLLWSLQAILTEGCSPMVLPWWKILCLNHLHACGLPLWMVSFPSQPLILSPLFRASLYPHKKANSESNMRLVYPSKELYRFPLFWILIYGISHTFWLTSPDSLLTECLLYQITLWYCLFWSAPCVSDSSLILVC